MRRYELTDLEWDKLKSVFQRKNQGRQADPQSLHNK